MFKCQVSGRVSKPGEKPFKIVTKTREKVYENKKRSRDKIIEFTTTGWEIVEEKVVCKEVYDVLVKGN